MKDFTKEQVDDILRLKYGKVVTDGSHVSWASNSTLSKIFSVSGSKIYQLC